MESESFNLSWSDFSSSATESFKKLLTDTSFADVTLVCEDDTQMTAHKVVLGSCSQFFQKILLKNPHQHPLIYLTEVKYGQLKSLLNFIYLGETEVGQDDLGTFMKIAKKLEIQGLIEHNIENSETATHNLYQTGDTKIKQETDPGDQHEDSSGASRNIKTTESSPEKRNRRVETFKQASSLSGHVKTLHTKPKLNQQIEIKFIDDAHPLEEEPQAKEMNVSNNIDVATAYEKMKCKHCNKTFTQSGTLNRHVKVVHEGVRYQCFQCEYAATSQYILRQHITKFHSETA